MQYQQDPADYPKRKAHQFDRILFRKRQMVALVLSLPFNKLVSQNYLKRLILIKKKFNFILNQFIENNINILHHPSNLFKN